MRFREDKPGDPARARAAVAEWREQNPAGTERSAHQGGRLRLPP